MSDEGGIVEGQFRELPDIPDKEPLPPLPATVGGMIGGTGGGNAITNKSEERSVEQQSPTQASDTFLQRSASEIDSRLDTLAVGGGVVGTGLIGIALGISMSIPSYSDIGFVLVAAGASVVYAGGTLTVKALKRTQPNLNKS